MKNYNTNPKKTSSHTRSAYDDASIVNKVLSALLQWQSFYIYRILVEKLFYVLSIIWMIMNSILSFEFIKY